MFIGSFIEVTSIPVPAGDALTAELTEFVNCIQNDTNPTVTGQVALQSLEIAERILGILQAKQSASWPESPLVKAACANPVSRYSETRAGTTADAENHNASASTCASAMIVTDANLEFAVADGSWPDRTEEQSETETPTLRHASKN